MPVSKEPNIKNTADMRVVPKQLPISKLIEFLKERHKEVLRLIMEEHRTEESACDILTACLSVGESIDSEICLGDELGDPTFYRGDDRDHWMYWLGFWNEFVDEPFWPMTHVSRHLIPATVKILQESAREYRSSLKK